MRNFSATCLQTMARGRNAAREQVSTATSRPFPKGVPVNIAQKVIYEHKIQFKRRFSDLD